MDTRQIPIEVHPIQVKTHPHTPPRVPKIVTMRAYEVYCHLYRPQEAIVTGGCRGGFGASELIAFLYAYPFPKNEWERRVQEAFNGMKGF